MSQGIDKRILRSRKALLRALPHILSEKPLENVTVREIAEVAGINRKTFYAHYATPTELHLDLANEIANGIIRRMSDRPEPHPADFVAAMAKMAREFSEEFTSFICHDNLAPLRTLVFTKLSPMLASHLFPTSANGVLYAASLIGSASAIYATNLLSPSPRSLPEIEEIHLACISRNLV